MAKYYYLGPWQWRTEPMAAWYPPPHTIGLIDMRAADGSGVGFFACCERLHDSAYVELGDGSDLSDYQTTRLDREAWRSELGLTSAELPDDMDTLADLLIWTFERCGDPTWALRFKPPIPGPGGALRLYLGGHSLIHSRQFADLHQAARQRILEVARADMARIVEFCNLTPAQMHERGIRVKPPAEFYRQVARLWQRKYGLADYRDLFPRDLRREVRPPLKPGTTLTDDFNRPDLGAAWTAVDGWWSIYNSQQIQCTGGGSANMASARYESDLSTDDHYAQLEFTYAENTYRWLGPAARFAATAETAYVGLVRAEGGLRKLVKCIGGTLTDLGSDAGGSGPPQTVKVWAVGSTIKLFDDDVEIFSVTDTSITGNLRCGLGGDPAGTERGDDFLAEDVPAVILSLSWSPSPSPDVDHYNIYKSDADSPIALNGSPHAEAASSPWQEDVTGFTGRYLYLVRAVDADGNEEANIREMVSVALQDGAEVAFPADPIMVEAEAISGGRIEVRWLYDPRREENGPGAAHEARIYWDAGSGAVDFSAPHATVPMNHPTTATRYTWQSEPLTGGQEYRFVVRIATAAWPSGIETQNIASHAATADSDMPEAPELIATLI